jgi:hypothetical protein
MTPQRPDAVRPPGAGSPPSGGSQGHTRYHLRRTGYITAAIVAAATLIACGTGTGSPSSTGTNTAASTAASTAPAPTTPAIAYPTDPAAYAAAVRDAWKNHDSATLDALTAGSAESQLTAIPGSTNKTWHAGTCDGTAGSMYCSAFNDNGDKLTIKVVSQLLGQAHAADGVQFDPTVLTGDVVAEFVQAWQDGNTWRMHVLAPDAVVTFATGHAVPAAGYQRCGNSGMGTSFVTVYSPSGPDYAFRVHLDPSITPPIYDLASTGAPTVQGPGIC